MTDRLEETFEAILGNVKEKIERVEDELGEFSLPLHNDPDSGLAPESMAHVAEPAGAQSGSVALTSTPVEVEHYVRLARGAYLLPNYVSDYLMKNLSLGEQSVFNRLYRLSRGFHKKTEPITIRNLAESCGLNAKLTANIIKSLASKRILKIIYSNPFTKKVKFKLVLPREVEQRIVLCGVCHNLILENEEWKYYPITRPDAGRAQAVTAHSDCVDGDPLWEGDPVH